MRHAAVRSVRQIHQVEHSVVRSIASVIRSSIVRPINAVPILSIHPFDTSHAHRSFSTTNTHIHPKHSRGGGTIAEGTSTIEIDKTVKLSHGGVLSSLSINYFDSLSFDPSASSKPIVYIMPSMSHSGMVTRSPAQRASGEGKPGWWEDVIGVSNNTGISLQKFRIISASPLGGPYGTTSPLSINPATGKQYRASFPLITPLDQARVHAMLLDAIGVEKVHAIVGASMGGMAILQFAAHFPERYDRLIAICTTGQTSASTQALRSVQRAAVRMDPFFFGGDYADAPVGQNTGPIGGLGIARMFGTICYRSRAEFDARFSTKRMMPVPAAATAAVSSTNKSTTPAPSVVEAHLFEVEKYLHHQASTFTGRYDANCYLTLSQCMDLQDLAAPPSATPAAASASTPPPLTYDQACKLIPSSKQIMLLPIASDALIPAEEMERLASVLGSQGKRVHVERIHSLFGHDAFLKESTTFNPRFAEFLDPETENGVDRVRQYVNSLFDI